MKPWACKEIKMQEIDMQKINKFLQREDLDGHLLKLKTRCLAADGLLREVVAQKEHLLQQSSELQSQLSNANSEIQKLNGKIEGLVELINEHLMQEEGE